MLLQACDFVAVRLTDTYVVVGITFCRTETDRLGMSAHTDGVRQQSHVQVVCAPVCQFLLVSLLHRVLQGPLRWQSRPIQPLLWCQTGGGEEWGYFFSFFIYSTHTTLGHYCSVLEIVSL